MIWGSGGSKSRLAEAAGAEPAGQMRDEKLHAVVARSTFASQNVQDTPGADHFWQLRCPKSARRCGAKHISKSKCTKHTILGPLLEVEMSKKCTPLWREAHFEVKMLKTQGVRTTFGSWDVEKVHAVVARSTFRSQNVKNTRGSDHFWRFRCLRFACFTTLHYTTLHYTTTTTTTTQLHSTTLHYAKFHYTKLHSTTLHCTTLRYTTFHYTSLHYTTLHSTTLQLQLHSITFRYTKLHYTTVSHRIHGAGIYANIGGILMVNVTIYSSTMDPMGIRWKITTLRRCVIRNYGWDRELSPKDLGEVSFSQINMMNS